MLIPSVSFVKTINIESNKDRNSNIDWLLIKSPTQRRTISLTLGGTDLIGVHLLQIFMKFATSILTKHLGTKYEVSVISFVRRLAQTFT